MTQRSNSRRYATQNEEAPLLVAALNYAERGLPVFPCKCADKSPLVRHGFRDATTNAQQIRSWWLEWPDAMIGMPTGRASGIDVLDLDVKPEEYIDGREFVSDWPQLSPVTVRTPSGGIHLWFNSTGQVRNSSDHIAPGVDTRGEGGFVIVPPSRNHNGDDYSFANGSIDDIAELPHFPNDLFARLGPRHQGGANADPQADPGTMRAAMRVIANHDLGWDDWKKLGLAIFRATGGSEEGFAIWDEWSNRSTKYDADNTRREWQSIERSPPSRIGAGTIFYHANRSDPAWQRSAQGALVLSSAAPVVGARAFVQRGYLHDGVSSLVYYRSNLYEWTGTHYEECDDDHIRSKIYEFLDHAITPKGGPFNPTSTKVNAVVDALKALLEQNSRREAPFWIDQSGRTDQPAFIACSNGLLNLETRELSPHSPLLFNLNALPYDYNPDAGEPERWVEFLRQVVPDQQARSVLQEIFGLMLTTDTSYQKIFMLIGPKRSGKGTIARVLTALTGKSNVANPTMASLTGEFGLWPLIDKQLAIISDARLGTRVDASVVTERLLSISGEDGQTINRKHKSFWFGRLFTRFLILSNELPRMPDASGALASRFVILMTPNSFLGREDRELTDRLLTELPGILNWAVRGLDRLRERGHFLIPQASLEAIQQLEDLASPVGAFLRDWCSPERPDGREKVKLLYEAYRYWCEQNGQRASSAAVFGRNLRAIRPGIRTVGKGKKRAYIGARLSREGFEQYQEARDEHRGGRMLAGEED